MGLFTRRPAQLPTTSYGYTAPPGATAHGWECNNEDCGTGDDPAPRSWPFRCTLCGGFADPNFDEPWHEEARGLRLQMLLDREIRAGRRGGNRIYEAAIREWQYGRALAAGDLAGAEDIRAQLTAWLIDLEQRDRDFGVSSTHFMVVMHALDYGQTDAAVAELQTWYARADTSDVANNNDNRNNCRTLLSCQLRFLEHPRGADHPAARQIAADARNLGAAVQRELPTDLEQQCRRLR